MGAIALAVILGCAASKVKLGSSQGSLQELEPEAAPGTHAVLVYNVPKVPVEVRHSVDKAGAETLEMTAFGQTYETEGYVRAQHTFSLKQADGDTFDPPLPLLSDDLIAPWSGNITSGGVSHNAKAIVKTSDDTVKTPKQTFAATLATVKLELDSGGKTPAERTLKFWIVKGRGVIQSEFSMGIKRLPAD